VAQPISAAYCANNQYALFDFKLRRLAARKSVDKCLRRSKASFFPREEAKCYQTPESEHASSGKNFESTSDRALI